MDAALEEAEEEVFPITSLTGEEIDEDVKSLIDLREALKIYAGVRHSNTFELLKSIVSELEEKHTHPTSKDVQDLLNERINALCFLNRISV